MAKCKRCGKEKKNLSVDGYCVSCEDIDSLEIYDDICDCGMGGCYCE